MSERKVQRATAVQRRLWHVGGCGDGWKRREGATTQSREGGNDVLVATVRDAMMGGRGGLNIIILPVSVLRKCVRILRATV